MTRNAINNVYIEQPNLLGEEIYTETAQGSLDEQSLLSLTRIETS